MTIKTIVICRKVQIFQSWCGKTNRPVSIQKRVTKIVDGTKIFGLGKRKRIQYNPAIAHSLNVKGEFLLIKPKTYLFHYSYIGDEGKDN